ncbi:ABC-three component system middle component 2 [Microbacterium sp. NPDC056736]|uniref:ABC-three component system middle component 2 n=1 Tax=Microbacterium sp. NPDC056736 TaxID=3345932 RepID=UPI00366DADB0
MTSQLNGQLEVGLRVSVLLASVFPRGLDIGRLVLLDYALLHSGDLGGPSSIHPPLPLRSGELGMKRAVISAGAELACRVGLAEASAESDGIVLVATERAPGFLGLLRSPYLRELSDRAKWVSDSFGEISDQAIREQMSEVFGHRAEEFHSTDESGAGI